MRKHEYSALKIKINEGSGTIVKLEHRCKTE